MLHSGYEPDLVSIITPAYNAERFIDDTIRSVLAQTYRNWEMVVVNDGSGDRTAEIVLEYSKQDPRIRLVSLPPKVKPDAAGPTRARTVSLEHSRGRYVAFLDSDDLWLPEKLERQVRFMKEKNAAFSFTAFRRFSIDGAITGCLQEVPETVTYHELLVNNVVGCLTVMIDREQVKIPKMTPGYHEDYMLWLAIFRGGVTGYGLNEDLARYRVVTGSRSSNRLRAVVWRWKNYRIQEKFSAPVAAFYFVQYVVLALAKHIRF